MSTPPLPQWQSASKNAQFIEPAVCSKRANRFERQIRRRNYLEYAAGGLLVVLFGASTIGAAIVGEWAIGLSMALSVVGVLVVLWNLRRRASNIIRRPEDACLIHLRRQYLHQYEALRSVPVWYIGPLIPGMVLLFGVITARAAENIGWAKAIEGIVEPALISSAVFAAVAGANWIGARRLKRKIEQIDALA